MTPIDKARSNRMGLVGYVGLLALLPGTVPDIAERTGMRSQNVRVFLNECRRLGLVSKIGEKKGKPRSPMLTIWGFGICERQPGAKPPRPQLIAFASLLNAMGEPATIQELREETGMSLKAIGNVVKALKKHKMSHVQGWVRHHGCPIAKHVLGRGFDDRRPVRKTKAAVNRNYQERRKRLAQEKATLLTGVNSVFDWSRAMA